MVIFLRVLSFIYPLFLLKHHFSSSLLNYSHQFTNIPCIRPTKYKTFSVTPPSSLQLLMHFSASFHKKTLRMNCLYSCLHFLTAYSFPSLLHLPSSRHTPSLLKSAGTSKFSADSPLALHTTV